MTDQITLNQDTLEAAAKAMVTHAETWDEERSHWSKEFFRGKAKLAVSAYLEADSTEEELHEISTRMAKILTDTANALKGEPEPRTSHSWHDLAEVAKRAVAQPELAARAEQAEQAVARVRELREEYVIYAWDGEVNFPKLDANGQKVVLARLCRACSSEDGMGAAEDGEWDDGYDDVDYPCPTIRALDGDGRG